MHPVFWATLLSIFAAQAWKVIAESVVERRLKLYRFFETGGMPSSHTSAVTTLASGMGVSEGFSSPVFAVSLVAGIYFIFEATGLRQEVGKQARVLNEVLDELIDTRHFPREKLRELRGHTWSEVFFGFLLGLFIAMVFVKA
ncbi:MAG: divergent PAP2 family protein [Candidatus Krumholzibacteria bacterium]|jgi:hypothetical protein|nr:divergent PAP2 family protein [Candidatus Krumholzibacteria bacterium]MDP6668649.1 divergent PAP2 family protein [Candidatus Krumholzibacteria bacterium]MDP6796334.1 divergent PAP2 family protein [Candidatus Krumholzibacteria bacterium]MDP7021020.1 divergent PAP2 family protein [Candidatus Krumholzibacteria bacterium]